jgi:hypothetical protein
MPAGQCYLCGGTAQIEREGDAAGKIRGFYRVDCPRCGMNSDASALTYWVDPSVDLDQLRAQTERARRHLARNARVINAAAVTVARIRTA